MCSSQAVTLENANINLYIKRFPELHKYNETGHQIQ